MMDIVQISLLVIILCSVSLLCFIIFDHVTGEKIRNNLKDINSQLAAWSLVIKIENGGVSMVDRKRCCEIEHVSYFRMIKILRRMEREDPTQVFKSVYDAIQLPKEKAKIEKRRAKRMIDKEFKIYKK